MCKKGVVNLSQMQVKSNWQNRAQMQRQATRKLFFQVGILCCCVL